MNGHAATSARRHDPRRARARTSSRTRDGRVIYVGKAKSLRQRLSQLLPEPAACRPGPRRWSRPPRPSSGSRSATTSRRSMLEYSLIKQHQPRFNVRLRDDKSYPFLAVTARRRVAAADGHAGRSGARACATSGRTATPYAIRETLDLLLRTFPVRTCSDNKFEHHQRLGRPCLLFHIEKCSGPVRRRDRQGGLRRARRRAARVPRRRHRHDRQAARDARCARRPTRSSSSGRPVCATGSPRCARRSSASRWWPTATRTST